MHEGPTKRIAIYGGRDVLDTLGVLRAVASDGYSYCTPPNLGVLKHCCEVGCCAGVIIMACQAKNGIWPPTGDADEIMAASQIVKAAGKRAIIAVARGHVARQLQSWSQSTVSVRTVNERQWSRVTRVLLEGVFHGRTVRF